MLTYLAMLRLQGIASPPFHALPESIRNDIKGIWGSYRSAQDEGNQFLFSIGNPGSVKVSCAAAKVGKSLPQDLYVHRSAEDELPALLRLLIFAAQQVVGDVVYDLVKIATDGRAVSFLAYPNFDEDPHPALLRSVRVYLPKASIGVRDYRAAANPPILHRKELLVTERYPHYEKFRDLTRAEESAGLLSQSDIGFQSNWIAQLQMRGFEIVEHRLRQML
jgi:DNA phosphorothioation-associated putative methyltransferase